MPADPKPRRRLVDPAALRLQHERMPRCCLCGRQPVSVHHVVPRSRGGDDVPANLVSLCGSGTTGCHGRVEARDAETRALLGAHLRACRPDVVVYVSGRVGDGWLDVNYP